MMLSSSRSLKNVFALCPSRSLSLLQIRLLGR